MKKRIACIIIIIFLFLAFTATVSIEWLYDTFGHLSMDEIIFHLKVPMQGTNTDIVLTYFKESMWKIILFTAIISGILIYPMIKDVKFFEKKMHTSEKRRVVVINLIISIIVLVLCINRILQTTDIIEYIESQEDNSEFIENEYVDPKNAKIEFLDEKRNLIYIYLESMETTYCAKEQGGRSEKDLIPEITALSKKYTNFTDKEEVGGAYVLSGTSWTAGAMTAQTLGVPLKLKIDNNALGDYSIFLGGAYGIGEVLKDNGYHNFLLLGSDASFGGRKNLFKQHGDYEIWDFESAMAEKKVSEKIWWGFTDNQLYEFAKEKILNLAEKDQPFSFTMLTTDTHFPEGYKCSDCENKWNEQYKNVISCSSKRVGEFIEWAEQQEFFDNTTIVIVGDHLTMQSNFFEIPQGEIYDKKVVSIIINPAVETENIKNRRYSTIDLYPTTLAAMGATIEGNRLALGVNLFSDEKTIIEEYGRDYVNSELEKNSTFYNNNILVTE